MRRADRLFQIVQWVRGRRLTTAADLAKRLEVSERTIYRDIADLQYQGVPIEGEAGVGYRLGRGFELPPLMFSSDEASALLASVRMAQAWQDPAMALAAQSALAKILSVVPASTKAAARKSVVFAPPLGLENSDKLVLQALREAAQSRTRATLSYQAPGGRTSVRIVRPLACFFWGNVWTLAAWCETRVEFRSFRLDRIQTLALVSGPQARFAEESGKQLADFLRQAAPKQALKLLSDD